MKGRCKVVDGAPRRADAHVPDKWQEPRDLQAMQPHSAPSNKPAVSLNPKMLCNCREDALDQLKHHDDLPAVCSRD